MSAYKDRIAETERGAWDVPMEPGSEEKVADRHAVASGEETNTSTLAKEDWRLQMKNNLKKLRKTVRFEQEAPQTSPSSSTHVSLENLANGEKQDRPEPVLVQNSGHALDVFYELDGRESCYIKEVLYWYRGEDAGDLRRSALNE